MLLKDIIQFRGDKLFNGAVNIEWILKDHEKAHLAAESFVFHGPAYHGVSQDDVDFSHGHKLIDTAAFTRAIIKRAYGFEDMPFTLAIAGYGTGKSHLGLTIAELLNDNGKFSYPLLQNISSADSDIAEEIEKIVKTSDKPCLAISLNGLDEFDFYHGLFTQITQILTRDGHDVRLLENLLARFVNAVGIIQDSNSKIQEELCEFCDVENIEDVIDSLNQHSEHMYSEVSNYFEQKRGRKIWAYQGETITELIEKTVEHYCGEGNPYQSIVILFDEFGKYMEFATTKSHFAGSGVLQHLFEAIQNSSPYACFVGFIQFELNAYMQRMANEHKNEMQRYVTRYQSADQLYLSTNLETLIAHLIEKKSPEYLNEMFDKATSRIESSLEQENINRWFQSSKNMQVWNNKEMFHNIIRKGAWPLSSYSVWLLYYLSAVGNNLQERSAFALLIDVFKHYEKVDISKNKSWQIAAVDMMNAPFIHELISSEETTGHSTIMQSYQLLISKYGNRYTDNQIRILKAIVLASKLGVRASDKDDAIDALGALSKLDHDVVYEEMQALLEEYNAIEWDDAYKSFDLLGDSLPRSQFIAHIRRSSSGYDEKMRSQLFVASIEKHCRYIKDIESEFGEENKIISLEWKFKACTARIDTIERQIQDEVKRCLSVDSVKDPRGTVFYLYLGKSEDIEGCSRDVSQYLQTAATSHHVKAVPILVMVLYDKNGELGQALAEISILESLSDGDKAKYGNLVESHFVKLERSINDLANNMILQRNYITSKNIKTEGLRLKNAVSEIFKQIFTRPIPFPFDGFNNYTGNAFETCSNLIRQLLHFTLDYERVMSMAPKDKNRATEVLKEEWGIFMPSGNVNRRPENSILRKLTVDWDDAIKNHPLSLKEMYDTLVSPPYGANRDSAGLVMAVFISAREKTLSIMKDGQEMSIKDWANDDNLFKNKHFNPDILENVNLVELGEDSSEWESMLDEWETATSHYDKIECMQRADALKQKLRIPSDLLYREESIRDRAVLAEAAIDRMREDKFRASSKVRESIKTGNIIILSEGCVKLKNMIDSLEEEKHLWDNETIDDLRQIYTQGRQEISSRFTDWLLSIAPQSESPEHVGEFKATMLEKVQKNLDYIDLDNQALSLEKRVRSLIKNVEDNAESRRLQQTVQNWISSNLNIIDGGRVKDLRAAKEVAAEHMRKLRGMYKRLEQIEILDVRRSLDEFAKSLDDAEKMIVKRANQLWKSSVTDLESIELLLEEINSLIRAYDGIDDDLEDFNIIRNALRAYKRAFNRLDDESLSWDLFEKLSKDIENEIISELDEEELPWDVEDVMQNICKVISNNRKQQSREWTETILVLEQEVPQMDVSVASPLQNKLEAPPYYVTESDMKKIKKIKTALEKRLNEIKIDWLVEKFMELSAKERKKFLDLIH